MPLSLSRRRVLGAAISASLFSGSSTSRALGRKFDKLLPAGDRVDNWSLEEQSYGLRHFDQIFPVRNISRSANPRPFLQGPNKPVHFSFGGQRIELASYAKQAGVAGLLILKDGLLREERYSNGLNRHARWASFSMQKSFVSVLIGIAIGEGLITSVDDPIGKYIPALRGGALATIKIIHILQMSSGIEWNEDYADPKSDANIGVNIWSHGKRGDLLRFISQKRLAWQPGTRFQYNSLNTQILIELLKEATGKWPSKFLEERIWKPAGMSSDAWWQIENDNGIEDGSICATLGDYGRFGQLMCDGGRFGDLQIIPSEWIVQSTTPSPLKADYGFQYGYMWWLRDRDRFLAHGHYGQLIYVNPSTRLVIVTLCTRSPQDNGTLDLERESMFVDAVEDAYH